MNGTNDNISLEMATRTVWTCLDEFFFDFQLPTGKKATKNRRDVVIQMEGGNRDVDGEEAKVAQQRSIGRSRTQA